jgi:hypothetical protein|tara:strand:+ start:1280 stop:1741 length:462 start_codon:yes stop_codon:yes gene_type:complete
MTVHDMHLEISETIEADAAAIYALISDLPRMGEWSTENIGGEWISGTPGAVGSRFLGTNRIKSFEWSVPVEITIAEPDACFEFVAAPDDGPYVRWTYRLEPLEMATRVTEIWDVIDLPPSLAKMTDEQLAGRKAAVRGTIEATLAGIKTSAER